MELTKEGRVFQLKTKTNSKNVFQIWSLSRLTASGRGQRGCECISGVHLLFQVQRATPDVFVFVGADKNARSHRPGSQGYYC